MAEETRTEHTENIEAPIENPSEDRPSRGNGVPRRSLLEPALYVMGGGALGALFGKEAGYRQGETASRMPFIAAVSEPARIVEQELTNGGEFTFLGEGEISRVHCRENEPGILTEKEVNVRFLKSRPLLEILKEIKEPHENDTPPQTTVMCSTPEEGELTQAYRIKIPEGNTDTGIFLALPEGANVHVAPVGPEPEEVTMEILQIAGLEAMRVLSLKTPNPVNNSSVFLIVNAKAPSTPQPDTVSI